jgi:hypothetical protein
VTTSGNLPPEEGFAKCRIVYDVFEETASINKAAAAAGVHWNSAQRWLAKPKKWDPFLDEVAIDRAMQGEYEVYKALTYWETIEFYQRLLIKRDALGGQSLEWSHFKRMVREGIGLSEAALNSNLDRWTQRDVSTVAA